MSNSIDLRVTRNLELLSELVRTGVEYVKREEQLSRLLTSRHYGVVRKGREALEKINARLDEQTATAQARMAHRQETIRAVHETRSARIERCRITGIREIPRRAQEVKSLWLGDLQMRQFNADRKRTADNEASEKALAALLAKLDAEKARLVKTQKKAWRSFFGYASFLSLLPKISSKNGSVKPSATCARLFENLELVLDAAEQQVRAFRKRALPNLFSYLPIPLMVVIVAGGCGVLGYVSDSESTRHTLEAIGGALIALFLVLHYLGLSQGKNDARAIAAGIKETWRLHDECRAAAQARRERECREIEEEHERISQSIRYKWKQADTVENEFAGKARLKLEGQGPRVAARNDDLLHVRLARTEAECASIVAHYEHEASAQIEKITTAQNAELMQVKTGEAAEWERLVQDWQREITPLCQAIEAINGTLNGSSPAWDASLVERWTPAKQFSSFARFARLEVDLAAAGAIPKDQRLALPCGPRITLPLALALPTQGSLLFETTESGGRTVLGTINNIIFRVLCGMPPGKANFTIIDPVGLGESFAGLMQLADYEETLINRRIWTQRDQIEDRLGELAEHIEKVIQMYLRNQYATITEYNEQAGSVAEKYHFLVVADFPSNFSELAAKRLQSIAASGPRCGVFTLIHWDQRQPNPDGLVPDELRKNSIVVRRDHTGFTVGKEQAEIRATLEFDPPPDAELAVELTHKIGKSSIDSNRVEVPFVQVAPEPEQMWRGETASELKVAIGRTGATKLQYLAIGKGTRQHALFAGKTGSGKSTLFHVIITNLALSCSPDEVEFYLIDFKKGVEFKCYAERQLPHARVIAIESDREFGLSVLQRVDEELKRRGDMFRALGVQDVAGYKRAGGTESVPRSLLIIDEFQEFFVEDDAISQAASVLFDRIVRQGRAFGIHVLLGSQTLGGAYSLARTTLGQMVIRVALQCNEADAYLIMDDSNSAPRLLSRPGEGIYNDAAGAIEGNSPFQVVWLPDRERDLWLDKVHELAATHAHTEFGAPIVFEGNAPAGIRENALLRLALQTTPTTPPSDVRAWLGAPNSIKGPTEAVFHRQSGNNLIVVGQRDEAALTMLGLSMMAIAAQHPAGTLKLVLFDGTNPGSPDAEFIERIVKAIPHEVSVVRGGEVAGAINDLAADLKARESDGYSGNAPRVFLFVHGVQRFKKLRNEEDFSFSMSSDDAPKTGSQFNDLICEGAGHGIHIFATVDTFNNVNRFISRKALSEFEMRIVFQMSTNDSASLIDSPKAGNLGLHRAIFFNEHEGALETFRPYAMPTADWLREAGEAMRVP